MAKVDKLALVRLALHQTLIALDLREKLCVLADLYAGKIEASDLPRWYGNGGGTSGLEQGIYNHMTTFRRVANLWIKVKSLTDEEGVKKETFKVRDLLVQSLNDNHIDIPTEREHTDE